ncbi:putative periplasmic lipoprotein [Shewanella violacea]|uniref:Lipoprotein n=1 Tax=Shewanella violacea (strain JCM 10179 / CIP 106290 / LMG 19151 / DSS12) TaxID=637905 RepID=D4ZD72_SHEVD|nr:hypothetical protein [Shewanella violacea]BAI99993.1 hypothetical protein SVI_0023 [Shewanella violacea DSS12]
MKKCFIGLVSLAFLAACSSDDSNKVPQVSGIFSGVTYSEAGAPLKVTATAINLAGSDQTAFTTIVTLWDERDQQISYSGIYHQDSNKLTFANEKYECIPDNNLWLCSSAVESFTLAKVTPEAVSIDLVLGSYSAQLGSDSYGLVIAADNKFTILSAGCEANGSLSYELDGQVLMFELADKTLEDTCGLDNLTGIINYVSDNDELFSLEFQTVNSDIPITWLKR